MKLIKIFAKTALLCSTLACVSIPTFASSNFTEVEIDTISIYSQPQFLRESQDVFLVHNNGNPIQSDYFADGEDGGNNLFAIVYDNSNGIIYESAYFSNVASMPKEELVDMVSDKESSEYKTTTYSASENKSIKRYSWSFEDYGDEQAYLTTTLELDRTETDVDGKAGSVWDVISDTQLEKVAATRLNTQYTRLDVDQSNQYLVSYGPNKSSSNGTCTVSIDGGGIPSIGYEFDINGFSLTDLSSKSSNYGRWKYNDGFGNEDRLTTAPAIRATNTKGDFILELSHSINITSRMTNKEHNTGVISVYLTDH